MFIGLLCCWGSWAVVFVVLLCLVYWAVVLLELLCLWAVRAIGLLGYCVSRTVVFVGLLCKLGCCVCAVV